jgi:hypothetical protein
MSLRLTRSLSILIINLIVNLRSRKLFTAEDLIGRFNNEIRRANGQAVETQSKKANRVQPYAFNLSEVFEDLPEAEKWFMKVFYGKSGISKIRRANFLTSCGLSEYGAKPDSRVLIVDPHGDDRDYSKHKVKSEHFSIFEADFPIPTRTTTGTSSPAAAATASAGALVTESVAADIVAESAAADRVPGNMAAEGLSGDNAVDSAAGADSSFESAAGADTSFESYAGSVANGDAVEEAEGEHIVTKEQFIEEFMKAPEAHRRAAVCLWHKENAEHDGRMIKGPGVGKTSLWWRWPVVQSDEWATFLRSYSSVFMTHLLEASFGSLSKGVRLIARLLYGLDRSACQQGLEEAGFITGLVRLSPEDTMGMQYYACLTKTARIRVASYLGALNGGKSIMASEGECLRLQPTNCAEMKDYSISFERPVAGTLADKELITYNFTCKDLVEVTKCHLDFVSDTKLSDTVGIYLGPVEGEVIAIVLLCDHGGDEMQCCTVNLAYPGCRQKHISPIAAFKGKESYDILKKTFEPRVNEAIGRIQGLYCVAVEFAGGFDTVFIPRVLCGTVDNRYVLPSTLKPSFTDGGILQLTYPESASGGDPQVFSFRRKDIPQETDKVKYKVLPIRPFKNGDLKDRGMDQGRAGFCPFNCGGCDASSTKSNPNCFADKACCGVPWTVERHHLEVVEYLIANAPVGSSLHEGLRLALLTLTLTLRLALL